MLKNVIFDIGGVILFFNRDYLLSTYYNGKDYELLKEKLFYNWEQMDEDTITIEDYNKRVLSSLPKNLHSVALTVLNNWEYSMHYKKSVVRLIMELKEKGYKIYVLSNMTRHFIERDYKFPILKELDGIVYSAPIKMIKPSKEIYQHLINKYDLIPNECLYIDDLKPNLAEPAKLGLKTFHYQDNTEQLRKYILSL